MKPQFSFAISLWNWVKPHDRWTTFPDVFDHKKTTRKGYEFFCTIGTLASRGANGRPRVAVLQIAVTDSKYARRGAERWAWDILVVRAEVEDARR